MIEKAIEINDISFSYRKSNIYESFSLEILDNDLIFVIGINGSGKTTLLKIICSFLKPFKGSVKIFGKDINSFSTRALAKVISYVPQFIKSNIDYLVKDYLVLGRTAYIKPFCNPTIDDFLIVEKYAKKLHLENLLDKNFSELSGGERQIISICRALIQETKIIVMDEPMSSLDMGKQSELLNLISLINSEGKIIILSTHNPNHALSVKSKTCLIKKGKIIEFGLSHSVLNEDNIKKVYGDLVKLENNNVNFNVKGQFSN